MSSTRSVATCPGCTQCVAQQARVGRATVYRHWPRPDRLVLDAMASVDLPLFREPTAPVRTWLHGQLRKFADELTLPQVTAVAISMMLGGAGDPQTAVREAMVTTVNSRLQAAFTLAIAEGELDLETEIGDAQALLVGPLLHRTIFQGITVSDELIDRGLDSIGTWHDR